VSLPDTVHFLSDYGLRDEFVGVVHATVRRLAPHVRILDLTHGLQPFDVRGGSWLLARALPHLGPGVVLGVVDPGVGGSRRGVVVQVHDQYGDRWLVGPDNGLLMAAADATGPIDIAVDLGVVAVEGPNATDVPRAATSATESPGRWNGPITFDGRDLFAPAAAALCSGAEPLDLGERADPDTLVRLPPPVNERGVLDDGRRCLRAEVTWVDRFGNVKTSVHIDDRLAASLPLGTIADLRPERVDPVEDRRVRAVRAFEELDDGELGVMADADGDLAIVAYQRSAALLLDVGTGDLVELCW
jgi:S-adenosylmethionine hydrolase